MKRLALTVLATAMASLLSCVSPVQASPITYIESAIATGTLGGTLFTNQLVTVTLTGDTSGVQNPFGSFFFNAGSATVDVFGLGRYVLTGSIEAFSFSTNGQSIVGIAQQDTPPNPTQITGILTTSASAFSGYSLKGPLGPATGAGGVATGNTSFYQTNGGGTLHFTAQPGTSTFTAIDGSAVVVNGGTVANPTTLTGAIGQIQSTIGGFGTQDFFQFAWGGGPFSATGSVETANANASYSYDLYASGGALLSTAILNPGDNFTQTIALGLPGGTYVLGINANDPDDPTTTFTFGTPINTPVPEPASLTLTALGLAGVLTRYRRRHR